MVVNSVRVRSGRELSSDAMIGVKKCCTGNQFISFKSRAINTHIMHEIQSLHITSFCIPELSYYLCSFCLSCYIFWCRCPGLFALK